MIDVHQQGKARVHSIDDVAIDFADACIGGGLVLRSREGDVANDAAGNERDQKQKYGNANEVAACRSQNESPVFASHILHGLKWRELRRWKNCGQRFALGEKLEVAR